MVVTEAGKTIKANSYFALNLKDWGINSTSLIGNSVILEFNIEATKSE
jgi:hypothetical protein